MREILFKAKRIDNGQWVEGFFVNAIEECGNGERTSEIIKMNAERIYRGEYSYLETYVVDINTLCQYTGLTDKKGNKIWENDILQFEDTGEDEYKEGFDFVNRARVEFSEARWSLTDFVCNNSSVMEEMYDHLEFMELWQYCEVVGNFFDNDGILGGI